MSEWWTYSLSDLLLFSPRVYYRLFELHNHALWPAHILTMIVGLAMVFALARPSAQRTRFTLVALGALWIWVAWAFFWARYATINWAALYVAPVFALEGLMLAGIGLSGKWLDVAPTAPLVRSAGIALLAAALLGYPLIAPLAGRSWSAAEVFGIAPDPTVLATLAILAAARDGVRWTMMVVPLLWVMMSTATLWALEAPEFWIAPLLAISAAGLARLPRR